MPMQLQVVPVTAFQQNCSVIWCDRTRAAAIVEPTRWLGQGDTIEVGDVTLQVRHCPSVQEQGA
jgi:hypothetical protein